MRARSLRGTVSSILGLLVAAGVFLLIAVIAPDDGPRAVLVRIGLLYAAVFAAPPMALLLGDGAPGLAVAAGGGMFMAGMATMPGGNLLGLLMAAVGLLLLFVGGSPLPRLTVLLALKLVAYGVVLILGVWLVFDDGPLATLSAVLLAGLIAISGRLAWLWPRRQI